MIAARIWLPRDTPRHRVRRQAAFPQPRIRPASRQAGPPPAGAGARHSRQRSGSGTQAAAEGRGLPAAADADSRQRAAQARASLAAPARPLSAGRQSPRPIDAPNPPLSFADTSQLPRTVSGTVLDVSPHVLILGDAGSEQRFTLTPDALAWRGAQLEPAALHQGDHAVVRLHPSSRHVADRIWANIGRVTGIIIERSGSTLIVDEGATRQPQIITIQPRAVGRIQVRFPTLEPGYLVDIIGLRHGDELIGMTPATSQPAYPAHRLPEPALVSGHVPDSISGSATWHEPRDEPPGILGVAYPALDPETGCAEDAASGLQHGFARMPYLAIGSVLRVRNDCTGTDCLVPVTGCAADRPAVQRPVRDLRDIAARPDRRPDPGELRRARRRTRTWLLQRDHHDRRVTVPC